MHIGYSKLEHNVIRAMTLFMAMNNLPIRIVTNDIFRELVNAIRALRSPYVMSRPSVRTETLSTHAELRQSLYSRLRMPNTYTTVAFDGWTNCNGVKITNVMAISKGIAYYIKSIPNVTDRNTADWLDQHIRPVVDDMINNGIKINAFVTDNGSTESCVREIINSIQHRFNSLCSTYIAVDSALHTTTTTVVSSDQFL